MKLENVTHIEAPVEVVWALTEDVERWPDVTPTMTSVERLDDGPLAVGSQARIKQPGQGTRVWTVTRLEPGRLFAWSTKALGAHMEGSHELEAEPEGCVNRLGLEITGGTAGIVGRLLGRTLLKAITTENEGFKKVAESTVADTAG
ncbi:MAG TPA: SRPBCC family protein [Acidimicrobiales bacterium]